MSNLGFLPFREEHAPQRRWGTVRLVKSDGRTADIFNYPPVEALEIGCVRGIKNGDLPNARL